MIHVHVAVYIKQLNAVKLARMEGTEMSTIPSKIKVVEKMGLLSRNAHD